MMMILHICILLCLLTLVNSYINVNNNMNSKIFYKYNNNNEKKYEKLSIYNNKNISNRNHKLYLDFFGLGPTEFIVILAASALLFGPETIKRQLRSSGVKGEFVSSGWQAERKERIENLEKRAYKLRKSRLFSRIEEEKNEEED